MSATRGGGWKPLAEAFRELRSQPFPRNGRTPQLQDAYVTLADHDGYIAGIVDSMLKNGAPPAHPLRLLQSLRDELNELTGLPGEEGEKAEAMLMYLDKVETVAVHAMMVGTEKGL